MPKFPAYRLGPDQPTRGRGAVHYAGEGLGERWRMRQRLKSAASMAEWAEVPGVR